MASYPSPESVQLTPVASALSTRPGTPYQEDTSHASNADLHRNDNEAEHVPQTPPPSPTEETLSLFEDISEDEEQPTITEEVWMLLFAPNGSEMDLSILQYCLMIFDIQEVKDSRVFDLQFMSLEDNYGFEEE